METQMSFIADAADILETGGMWCAGSMLKKDRVSTDPHNKVCTMGALWAAKEGMSVDDIQSITSSRDIQAFTQGAWSDEFFVAPEIKALAQYLLDNDPLWKYLTQKFEANGSIVYSWNDALPNNESSVERIVRTLREADAEFEASK
jgi:hypothetical protein